MIAGSESLTSKAAIKRLAQDKGPFAIAKLVALMECGKEAVELSAAQALLDRGFGRAAVSLIGGDEDDPAINLKHTVEYLGTSTVTPKA